MKNRKLLSIFLALALLLAGAVGLHQLVPAGLGLLQLPLGRLGGGLQLLQALGHLLVLGEELL